MSENPCIGEKILKVLVYIFALGGSTVSIIIAIQNFGKVGSYKGPPDWVLWVILLGGIFVALSVGLLMIVIANISVSASAVAESLRNPYPVQQVSYQQYYQT